MLHLGINLVKRKYELKLIRDEFAPINTKPSLPYFPELAERHAYTYAVGSAYTLDWCNQYREICLKNYDLHMHYFSLLDKAEFDEALACYFNQYPEFIPVTDLSVYAGVEGYYVMILDEYKQTYIGKSNDIKKRIMQHWSIIMPFDRTLFPIYAYKTSCFSINFFRALDTTRIFVWKKQLTEGLEADLVRSFPPRFCTNRIGGDITTGIAAMATMNKRKL